MDIIVDFEPVRDLSTISFSDIVAAQYTGYDQVPVMEYPDANTVSLHVIVLHFAADLTAAEQAAVRMRLSTSPNEESLRSKAQTALDTNNAFLAIASPANAQTLAQVKALTRENNALIRLVLKQFDSTSGT